MRTDRCQERRDLLDEHANAGSSDHFTALNPHGARKADDSADQGPAEGNQAGAVRQEDGALIQCCSGGLRVVRSW